MDWQSSSDDFSSAETPERPGIKTAVICDDFPAADRAMRVLAALARQWDFKLNPVIWRFGQLNIARNHRRATDELANADFVIVSFSQPYDVPEPVEQWLEACTSAKRARSTTWLTNARKEGGWAMTFLDVHGTLTPHPEIPALIGTRLPNPARVKL
jgi:hypothetical protein